MSSRVLVVEDDVMQQTVLSTALTKRGYEVDVAADGLSAVNKLRNGSYDLALIDYNLPEIDGLASARLLRDLVPAQDRPKLIAVTASPEDLEGREREDRVFDATLAKPLEVPALLQLIDRELQAGAQWEAARAAAALWRQLGLDGQPAALVFPTPDPAHAHLLRTVFDISGRRPPELILLLRNDVERALANFRGEAENHLLPVVDLTLEASGADAYFSAIDRATWPAVASAISRFANRRRQLAETVRTSIDLDLRLLAYIHLAGKPFRPEIDPGRRECLAYPGFFPPTDIRDAAERLAARSLLERRFFERHHVCGGCASARVNVREECPRCHSAHLGDVSLIHHFRCAHQAPEADFARGPHLVCPKCRQHLRHYGSDYDRPGNVCSCNDCGAISPEPTIGFTCLDCGVRTPGDAITTRDAFTYALTESGLALLKHGAPALPGHAAALPAAVTAEWERTGRSAALIALRYGSRNRIVARRGSDSFTRLRRVFLDNLISALEADCSIEPQGGRDGDTDHLLIRDPSASHRALLTPALLDDCARQLAEDLDPTLTILHWPL